MNILKYILLTVILIAAVSSCSGSIPPQIRLELVADGFTSPVALIDPGDGSGRLFVVDQTGLIWILFNGKRLEPPFIDVREKIVELNDFYEERGLLGLAFHPNFADNGRFYVSYSGHLQNGSSADGWDHTIFVLMIGAGLLIRRRTISHTTT